MTTYSKYNIIYLLQKWIDSVPGQTFLNYAYSWGASIVILGTLFKLTHLPGADIMLFLGMGTEVMVFFLYAFDRPFDKTQDGQNLATHVSNNPGETIDTQVIGVRGAMGSAVDATVPMGESPHISSGGNAGNGGTIIIGGGIPTSGVATAVSPEASAVNADQPASGVTGNVTWIEQQQQLSPEMEEATSNYVDQLKKLTEMLGKVNDQSERLTRDSEEMENLNRTLTGICKVYEMQLKGASAQIGTIDQINEQSRKMAGQIEQLNKIYTRMIEAMTVNMRTAAPQAPIDTNV
jgi:hypothetical protein